MKIGTNLPNSTLTRPRAGWKRALVFMAGVGFVFLAIGTLFGGEGWVALIPAAFALGCFINASEKYETIG